MKLCNRNSQRDAAEEMSGLFNSAKNSYYICGHLALKSRCICPTHTAKQASCLYFVCHVADAVNSWVPQLCWITCNVTLNKWVKWKNSMPPAVPMIWRGPITHLKDCSFCLTKIERDSKKIKVKIQNPSVPTAIKPVVYEEYLPIPKPSSKWNEFYFPKEELQ